jgi:hypothetical protein
MGNPKFKIPFGYKLVGDRRKNEFGLFLNPQLLE